VALIWHGEEAKARIKGSAADRVELGARRFRDRLRDALQVPGTGRGGTEAGASEPGEYPRKQTGHLRRNIQMEMDRERVLARVGTNVLYAKFLEFGTSKMEPRPLMANAVRDHAREVQAIIEGGPVL